jgi:hypothetical protein
VVGIAVALAGCGGGDDGSSAEGSPDLPEAKQPISEQLPAFERAASRLDCEDALPVVHPVLLSQPEDPESKQNCDDPLFTLRRVRNFSATDSQELGTAAIVDGEINGDEVALVWALDEQGNFKWIGGSNAEPQVGTEPPGNLDFKQNAVAFIEALRDDDCKAAYEAIATNSRLSYGSAKTFCRKFEDTFTATPEGFGSRLQQDPDAELVDLGTTRALAFYGVATEPAGYRTLVVSAAAEGEEPKVFDVVPAER